MNDMGFLNAVEVGGTILIPVICRNASDVPSEPDAALTYTVYGPDGAQVGTQTGTMTLTPGSKTGLRAVVLTASAGNGYASGSGYAVHISYDVSAAAFAVLAMFKVT